MIPLAKPHIDEKDIDYVIQALRSGTLSLGPFLQKFEENFAKKIGVRYAVAVNSGTSGLHLAIRALGITKNDEVITSPFSFIASANCILYENATPVFVDVEEETYNIDPEKIETKITAKTKALLIPHIFGQSANMTQIMNIAHKYHLPVIEDACESILATHHGKNTGTFGDIAVFAFYPNKQMTTGEGGIIVTNNERLYKYCKSAANQGRSDALQWLSHDKLGYNYRMDEMSAALGLSQLEKIDFLISKRQELAEIYSKNLVNLPEVKTVRVNQINHSSWFVYSIRVDEQQRDKLIEMLIEKKVQSKAYFFPCIHVQPFYQKQFGYQVGEFPVAEKLSRETLVLPFYPDLSEREVLLIIKILNDSLRELKREREQTKP
ncbi:DegT/DnrJ/EryC1/StrS family aminotransferase [Candidatus Woesearchaeota archaeon]|nr:DegT/DnrJ/EryC1/StrS family aminotransferase [Candidatus Woesearchaeota archaeon]